MLSADELKAEGNKAFSDKQYKKAAKIYRDALKLDPKNPILYSNRAQCFLMLQDYDRALKDTNLGINLTVDPKLLIKLYFRKGSSLLKLNEPKKAEYCFRRVLEYESGNVAAKKEIAVIELMKRNIEEISSSDRVIPVEQVNILPQEFKKLIQVEPLQETITSKVDSKISDAATNEINQLFANKQSKPEPMKSKPESEKIQSKKIEPGNALGPMAAIVGLRNVPTEKKIPAYKFVLNMSNEDYASTFAETGVDVEFLDFLLEAGHYSMNHKIVDNTETVFFEKLKILSTFKRFSLSILLCNQDLIKQILETIKNNYNDSIYNKYAKLLQIA